LEHEDSVGNKGIIYPGLAQRMSAGTGILHSEMNPSEQKNVHFVQMWVPPDIGPVNHIDLRPYRALHVYNRIIVSPSGCFSG
jgi:hypothetical protein